MMGIVNCESLKNAIQVFSENSPGLGAANAECMHPFLSECKYTNPQVKYRACEG
jgi:hypothetical protein